MSAALSDIRGAPSDEAMQDAARLAWLQAHLAGNRFLPSPPPKLMLCGDGDFRAIGAEFLGLFVRMAELAPHERVLDLGCGVGRMAVPLTQYLDDRGCYVGADVAAAAIAWCRDTITPVYPNFSFTHLDVQHDLYNPAGAEAAEDIRLPFPDASFDVILLVSVLTHLGSAALTRYAAEVSRLLAPGGRCFATAFMMNPPAREALRHAGGKVAFDPSAPGPEMFAHADAPLAAVAFDEDHLIEKFIRCGRRRRGRPLYGHWSGRTSSVFQDINIFE